MSPSENYLFEIKQGSRYLLSKAGELIKFNGSFYELLKNYPEHKVIFLTKEQKDIFQHLAPVMSRILHEYPYRDVTETVKKMLAFNAIIEEGQKVS